MTPYDLLTRPYCILWYFPKTSGKRREYKVIKTNKETLIWTKNKTVKGRKEVFLHFKKEFSIFREKNDCKKWVAMVTSKTINTNFFQIKFSKGSWSFGGFAQLLKELFRFKFAKAKIFSTSPPPPLGLERVKLCWKRGDDKIVFSAFFSHTNFGKFFILNVYFPLFESIIYVNLAVLSLFPFVSSFVVK